MNQDFVFHTAVTHSNSSRFLLDLAKELIIPHTVCSVAIQNAAVVRNMEGKLINASLDDQSGIVRFHGVPVSAVDRIATNGIIHVMGGVVLLDHSECPYSLIGHPYNLIHYILVIFV